MGLDSCGFLGSDSLLLDLCGGGTNKTYNVLKYVTVSSIYKDSTFFLETLLQGQTFYPN